MREVAVDRTLFEQVAEILAWHELLIEGAEELPQGVLHVTIDDDRYAAVTFGPEIIRWSRWIDTGQPRWDFAWWVKMIDWTERPHALAEKIAKLVEAEIGPCVRRSTRSRGWKIEWCPGSTYTQVITLTHEEWEAARDNSLAKLGCTLEQLQKMARTGDYASPDHRALWLMIKPIPSETNHG